MAKNTFTKKLEEKTEKDLLSAIQEYIFDYGYNNIWEERNILGRLPNHFETFLKKRVPETSFRPEQFFSSNRTFTDLEVAKLESMLSMFGKRYNEEQYNQACILGYNVLNTLIRNPFTDRVPIVYFQDGVRELTLDSDLSKSLEAVLSTGNGVFDNLRTLTRAKSHYNNVKRFAQYGASLTEISRILEGAQSQALRDMSKAIKRMLDGKRFAKAHSISGKKLHSLVINEDASRLYKPLEGMRTRREFGYSVGYAVEDGQVMSLCFVPDYYAESEAEDENKVDPHRVVWKTIEKILTHKGLEAIDDIALMGSFLGYMNIMSSLADMCEENSISYCFPNIVDEGPEIYFKDAVHPLLLTGKPVPNDIQLNPDGYVHVVAGPNDAGKTVLLKTAGLSTLLTQMGGPVPASEARVSPVKKFYTDFRKSEKVGSNNGNYVGELKELEYLLTEGDQHWLALLDEPVNGTSEEDAIDVHTELVYALQQLGIPTLDATHLHEVQQRISAFEDRYDKCRNLCFEVKGTEKNPVFTHNLQEGIAGKSYGDVVAQQNLPIKDIVESRGVKWELE